MCGVFAPMCHVLRQAETLRAWGVVVGLLTACACMPSGPPPQAELPYPPQAAACPAGYDATQLQAGARVYARTCMACHQADGRGMPGIFPPLRRHAPRLAQTQAGRTYMMAQVLWGVRGPLAVDGAIFHNLMPPQQGMLTDGEVADVLTYVTHAWDNCRSFSAPPQFAPAEVAQQRALPRAADAIFAARAATEF
jgi:mono/diheme cytochrome c family protein